MQIEITNITLAPVTIGELYSTILPGGTLTVTRSGSDLASMAGLQAAMAAQQVTVVITPSAAELASGFLAPPQAVQGGDVAPVDPATTDAGVTVLFRKAFPAAAPGLADDVTVFAVNTLPYKFRACLVFGVIATPLAGSLEIRTQAGGAGTLLGTLDSTLAGPKQDVSAQAASALAVPGAAEGLFIRRSDRGVAGEVFVLARREV